MTLVMSDLGALIICIVVIVAVVIFLSALLISYIYKRVHNIPTGDCAECRKGTAKLLKEYHKKYAKKS